MRLWMVNPQLLCRQHLLGEHRECHTFAGTILKGISLKGYLRNGLLETHNLRKRHRFLAREMKRRGYNHKSELPSFCVTKLGKIDREGNLKELYKRCKYCREIQEVEVMNKYFLEAGTVITPTSTTSAESNSLRSGSGSSASNKYKKKEKINV